MQTSHFLRNEASKLFFTDPDTWYCVNGEWLGMAVIQATDYMTSTSYAAYNVYILIYA